MSEPLTDIVAMFTFVRVATLALIEVSAAVEAVTLVKLAVPTLMLVRVAAAALILVSEALLAEIPPVASRCTIVDADVVLEALIDAALESPLPTMAVSGPLSLDVDMAALAEMSASVMVPSMMFPVATELFDRNTLEMLLALIEMLGVVEGFETVKGAETETEVTPPPPPVVQESAPLPLVLST